MRNPVRIATARLKSTSAQSEILAKLFWDGQLPLFTNLSGHEVFESCVAVAIDLNLW
jgi:hypothetical protein